jgi:isoleucyl-tRNA synthetase
MVLDEHGKKMSKSVGNAVDSFEIMAEQGADALRWYLMSTSPPWVPTRFDVNGVKEVASKVLDTLRNTYGFFSLYANIDGYDPAEHFVTLGDRPTIDRWIVSRCHSTIAAVTADMDGYDITKAVRKLQYFVLEDLSNWYVRLSRARFWKGDMDADKMAAYSTLREVLLATTKAMAPVAPFLSEAIYGRLHGGSDDDAPSSVHLCAFPEVTLPAIDRKLESAMGIARSVVVLGRAARNASNIKIRQPLARLLVAGVAEAERDGVTALEELILAELNVKEMEWAGALTRPTASPIFPALGPKHGKNVNQVAEAIRAMSADDVARLNAGENVSVSVGDSAAVVEPADVEIGTEGREGFAVQSDGDLSAALDTTLTDELVDEGFAREMINKIQFMRKEAGFDVIDRIKVTYEAGDRLKAAMERFASRVAAETLAASITEGAGAGELEKEWDVNGEWARIAVERVERGSSG